MVKGQHQEIVTPLTTVFCKLTHNKSEVNLIFKGIFLYLKLFFFTAIVKLIFVLFNPNCPPSPSCVEVSH